MAVRSIFKDSDRQILLELVDKRLDLVEVLGQLPGVLVVPIPIPLH